MNRETAESLLAAYLYDELPLAARAEMGEMLAADASLREQLRDMRLTGQLLAQGEAAGIGGSPGGPAVPTRLSDEKRAALFAAVGHAPPTSATLDTPAADDAAPAPLRYRPWPWWAVGLAAAAGVVIVAGAVWVGTLLENRGLTAPHMTDLPDIATDMSGEDRGTLTSPDDAGTRDAVDPRDRRTPSDAIVVMADGPTIEPGRLIDASELDDMPPPAEPVWVVDSTSSELKYAGSDEADDLATSVQEGVNITFHYDDTPSPLYRGLLSGEIVVLDLEAEGWPHMFGAWAPRVPNLFQLTHQIGRQRLATSDRHTRGDVFFHPWLASVDQDGAIGIWVDQVQPKHDWIEAHTPPRWAWPIDPVWTALASDQTPWLTARDIDMDEPIRDPRGLRGVVYSHGMELSPEALDQYWVSQPPPHVVKRMEKEEAARAAAMPPLATLSIDDWYGPVEPMQDSATSEPESRSAAPLAPALPPHIHTTDPIDAGARKLIEIIGEMSDQADRQAAKEKSAKEKLWSGVERKAAEPPRVQIDRHIAAARSALADGDIAEARRQAAIAAGVFYLYEDRLSDTFRDASRTALNDLREAISKASR